MSTPQGIVNELTYRCYEFNRNEHPETTWQQWATIFGQHTRLLESRYLVENTGGAGVAFRLCEGPCEETFAYIPESGDNEIWFLDGCWYCSECYGEAKAQAS